jgi:lipoate-protein ligase A
MVGSVTQEMKCLDLTLPTPAENLACDEALLDCCETGQGDEVLRFWESRTLFVAVGHANHISSEVNGATCEREHIPVLRRCSGGGTVLQGPGCLNYALILKMDPTGPLRSIASTNRFIMERHCAALNELLRRGERQQQALPSRSTIDNAPSRIRVQGHTDLSMDGLKVSGNAQRRKRRALLFHGTLLLQFNLSLIERILPMPSKQPAYRLNRAHENFLANLALTADSVKRALQRAWSAFEPLPNPPHESIRSLARDKYETNAWNLKFQ